MQGDTTTPQIILGLDFTCVMMCILVSLWPSGTWGIVVFLLSTRFVPVNLTEEHANNK